MFSRIALFLATNLAVVLVLTVVLNLLGVGRAVSAEVLTVPVSCSIEAAVCCRFEACSSVR